MKKGILLALLLMLNWACQDLNSVQPPAELDLDGQFGVYVDTTLTVTETRFMVDDRYNSGNALKLNIGAYEGFEAGFLLKFVGLPADETEIDSSYIELTSLSTFGDAQEDMRIGVYRVDEEWDEQEVNTLDQWHNYQPATLIGEYTFSAQDTLKMRFQLDTVLVNDWRRDADSNKGLYFKLENTNANYLREIESLETPLGKNWPKFCYYTHQDTVVTKDSSRAGLDVTIFNYNGNLFEKARQENDLIIASGIAARAFVRFEGLASLPDSAVIQEADLIMNVDDKNILSGEEGNILDNPNNPGDYFLRSVTEADSGLTSYQIDSSFVNSTNFNFNLVEKDDIISLNGKSERSKFGLNMIQNMLNGLKQSEWFYIQYKDEGQDVSVKKIYNSGDKNIKLHLRYFRVDNSGL